MLFLSLCIKINDFSETPEASHNGNYIEFELIEKELKDKTLEEVGVIKMNKNKVINEAKIVKCKSSIEIQKILDELVESFDKDVEVDVKNVRKNRRKETKKEEL